MFPTNNGASGSSFAMSPAILPNQAAFERNAILNEKHKRVHSTPACPSPPAKSPPPARILHASPNRHPLSMSTTSTSSNSNNTSLNTSSIASTSSSATLEVPSVHSVHMSPLSPNEASFLATRFKDLGPIGKGSFGKVHKVMGIADGKLYAIKISRKQFRGTKERERAMREVETMSELGAHPHLVQYFGAWEENGRLYIQTELCDLGSLESFLLRAGMLAEEVIWNFLLDLVLGVKHIHDHQILHLDLKPANIFIASHDCALKIGDFGLATHVGAGTNLEGDSRYVAAEVLQNQWSSAADIYSLGATIFEMAANIEMPSQGPAWHMLRSGNIPSTAGRSPELEHLMRKMMDPNPSLRPSADEILQYPTLQELLQQRQNKNRSLLSTVAATVGNAWKMLFNSTMSNAGQDDAEMGTALTDLLNAEASQPLSQSSSQVSVSNMNTASAVAGMGMDLEARWDRAQTPTGEQHMTFNADYSPLSSHDRSYNTSFYQQQQPQQSSMTGAAGTSQHVVYVHTATNNSAMGDLAFQGVRLKSKGSGKNSPINTPNSSIGNSTAGDINLSVLTTPSGGLTFGAFGGGANAVDNSGFTSPRAQPVVLFQPPSGRQSPFFNASSGSSTSSGGSLNSSSSDPPLLVVSAHTAAAVGGTPFRPLASRPSSTVPQSPPWAARAVNDSNNENNSNNGNSSGGYGDKFNDMQIQTTQQSAEFVAPLMVPTSMPARSPHIRWSGATSGGASFSSSSNTRGNGVTSTPASTPLVSRPTATAPHTVSGGNTFVFAVPPHPGPANGPNNNQMMMSGNTSSSGMNANPTFSVPERSSVGPSRRPHRMFTTAQGGPIASSMSTNGWSASSANTFSQNSNNNAFTNNSNSNMSNSMNNGISTGLGFGGTVPPSTSKAARGSSRLAYGSTGPSARDAAWSPHSSHGLPCASPVLPTHGSHNSSSEDLFAAGLATPTPIRVIQPISGSSVAGNSDVNVSRDSNGSAINTSAVSVSGAIPQPRNLLSVFDTIESDE